MAKAKKTTVKLPVKPFTGSEGNTFTKDNQPTPAQKSAGWQERRKERLLTQEILKQMLGKDEATGEENLKGYVFELVKLAKAGNPKAIETINSGLEDDIKKIELTGADGGAVESKMSDDQFDKLLNKIHAPSTDIGK